MSTAKHLASGNPTGSAHYPTGHSGHGSRVCEFGVTHSRCRCMDQTVTRIQCDKPEQHRPAPRHRADEAANDRLINEMDAPNA